MLGLLGFYDEFAQGSGQTNGSVHDAVRPAGEPDEADLVAYLDAGHVLIDVTESCPDAITGTNHRHSQGCSSPVTDGVWLWRRDFPHYVETHHVLLPAAFLDHVRRLNYRMPALITAQFAPDYNETMPVIGWDVAVPWRSTTPVLEPEPPTVVSKAQFDAATLAQQRNRPDGKWTKLRKPRRT